MDAVDWNLVDREATRYDPVMLLAEADSLFEAFTDYLGMEDPLVGNKVCIQIVPSGIYVNRYVNRKIYIDVDFINHDMPPLGHEIAHAVFSFPSFESVNEGFADFLHRKFITYHNWYYSGNIHQRLAVFWRHDRGERRIHSIQWMLDGYLTDDISGLEAQSWVTYLIERFGIASFMDYLEGGGYKQFFDVFAVYLEEVASDWTEYIMAIEPDRLWEENWDEVFSWFDS